MHSERKGGTTECHGSFIIHVEYFHMQNAFVRTFIEWRVDQSKGSLAVHVVVALSYVKVLTLLYSPESRESPEGMNFCEYYPTHMFDM